MDFSKGSKGWGKDAWGSETMPVIKGHNGLQFQSRLDFITQHIRSHNVVRVISGPSQFRTFLTSHILIVSVSTKITTACKRRPKSHLTEHPDHHFDANTDFCKSACITVLWVYTFTTHCTSVQFTNLLNVFWAALYYYYDHHHHHHYHSRDFLVSYEFEISDTVGRTWVESIRKRRAENVLT